MLFVKMYSQVDNNSAKLFVLEILRIACVPCMTFLTQIQYARRPDSLKNVVTNIWFILYRNIHFVQ